MNMLTELATRVTELEVKLGFAEDLLDQLNRLVFEQQRQIEALASKYVQLRDQLAPSNDSWRTLQDERPPHY